MAIATKLSLSDQVKRIPPATRPTVKAAIKTVKEIAPKADEITYRSSPPSSKSMMWKIVRYASAGENVVGVGTFSNHSTLFFYRGRELDDGSGLLHGSGKDSRYMTLHEPADAQKPSIKRLVRKAFKLAGDVKG